MILIYGISNCDTVKKTKKWFDSANIDYKFHDYKKDGASEILLKEFVDYFDLDVLINKRGTTWRKLPDQVKSSLNKESAIKIMAENPSVIKRPIIDFGKFKTIGYKPDQWAA